MYKYLISIILLFSSTFIFAKNTIVTGTAAAFPGMTIRLTTYDDYISNKPHLLASDILDKNGNFRLVFDINRTSYAILELDFRKSEIYLVPGHFYDIRINIEDDVNVNVNPYLAEKVLEYEFVHSPDNDINVLMQKLNVLYNTFIGDKENFNALYRKRDKNKINEFRQQIDQHLKDQSNEYFSNAIKYKIATLEDLARISSRNTLFDKYFKDRSILYHHVVYMDFFNQFFNNYLISSKMIKYSDLLEAIENRKDYYYLLDIMGRDSLLNNEILREMVMLRGLKDLFTNGEFKQSNIIKILKDFSLKSRFVEHSEIAKNIVSVMTKLKPGSEAPGFTLTDKEGNQTSLKNFRGKYVYLFFWTSWCIPCKKEFETLLELYNRYNDKVEFLGISVDAEYSGMYHYLNQNKYPWKNFHYDNDIDLIENYGVKTYPLFVMIARDGRIIRYPAPSPSENIERLFNILFSKEN